LRTFLLAGIILLVLRCDERVAPLVEYVDACAEAIEPILQEHPIGLIDGALTLLAADAVHLDQHLLSCALVRRLELHPISLPRIDETADPRASRVEHGCLTLLLDPRAA
jgi:hypothetical protein